MSCTSPEEELERALSQHECVVMMKVYGRFPMIRNMLSRLGLLENALMMSEASLPNEQCFRQLSAIGDDVVLPYFSTILVNKRWFA